MDIQAFFQQLRNKQDWQNIPEQSKFSIKQQNGLTYILGDGQSNPSKLKFILKDVKQLKKQKKQMHYLWVTNMFESEANIIKIEDLIKQLQKQQCFIQMIKYKDLAQITQEGSKQYYKQKMNNGIIITAPKLLSSEYFQNNQLLKMLENKEIIFFNLRRDALTMKQFQNQKKNLPKQLQTVCRIRSTDKNLFKNLLMDRKIHSNFILAKLDNQKQKRQQVLFSQGIQQIQEKFVRLDWVGNIQMQMVVQNLYVFATNWGYPKNQVSSFVEDYQQYVKEKMSKDYEIGKMIRLYTEDTFLYRFINTILRQYTKKEEIGNALPYLSQLLFQLRKVYKQQFLQKDMSKHQQVSSGGLRCYRGAFFSQNQIKRLKNNIGSYAYCKSFQSASINKYLAYNFITNTLMQIEIQLAYIQNKDNIHELKNEISFFADIKKFNDSFKQEQIIFSPLSLFKLVSVQLSTEGFYVIKFKHYFRSEIRKRHKNLQAIGINKQFIVNNKWMSDATKYQLNKLEQVIQYMREQSRLLDQYHPNLEKSEALQLKQLKLRQLQVYEQQSNQSKIITRQQIDALNHLVYHLRDCLSQCPWILDRQEIKEIYGRYETRINSYLQQHHQQNEKHKDHFYPLFAAVYAKLIFIQAKYKNNPDILQFIGESVPSQGYEIFVWNSFKQMLATYNLLQFRLTQFQIHPGSNKPQLKKLKDLLADRLFPFMPSIFALQHQKILVQIFQMEEQMIGQLCIATSSFVNSYVQILLYALNQLHNSCTGKGKACKHLKQEHKLKLQQKLSTIRLCFQQRFNILQNKIQKRLFGIKNSENLNQNYSQKITKCEIQFEFERQKGRFIVMRYMANKNNCLLDIISKELKNQQSVFLQFTNKIIKSLSNKNPLNQQIKKQYQLNPANKSDKDSSKFIGQGKAEGRQKDNINGQEQRKDKVEPKYKEAAYKQKIEREQNKKKKKKEKRDHEQKKSYLKAMKKFGQTQNDNLNQL